jgi:hypothetical protein
LVLEDRFLLALIPRDVIYKLLGFTAAMIAGPIGMYFLTVNTIFNGRYFSASQLARIYTD